MTVSEVMAECKKFMDAGAYDVHVGIFPALPMPDGRKTNIASEMPLFLKSKAIKITNGTFYISQQHVVRAVTELRLLGYEIVMIFVDSTIFHKKRPSSMEVDKSLS